MVSRVARTRPRLVEQAAPEMKVVALQALAPAPPVAEAPARPTESLAEQIRRLQAEAKSLAKNHVDALRLALIEVERLSEEIGEGGDVYPTGIRELARRFAGETDAKVQALMAIVART
ncbi:MAG: hypothetical protein KA085_16230 [Phenylobacterium sp.]|uniref:hypothetical protein n=1 Tax=Phenylobacterium sp. TaxID=1871053 RepID=UPI001B6292B7|nr:hypothetical protein [Phenylobacterium sp.]MBP7649565.1 hypothetical protein [Phenylobacterium sp.]MBP7817671.1 hypothetical protein [Phenylobacterium sp.]MBP9230291.1 hypothetical protein [Phenylobacterium sp.]MBP9755680.1 hypothetical protein [Phenylobacterium sp.]